MSNLTLIVQLSNCATYHPFGFHVIFQTWKDVSSPYFRALDSVDRWTWKWYGSAGRTRGFQYEVENGRVINSADTNRFRSVHYTRWTAKTHRSFRAAALHRGISYRIGNSCALFSNCGRRFNRLSLVTYEWCSCRLLRRFYDQKLTKNAMRVATLRPCLARPVLIRAVLNT